MRGFALERLPVKGWGLYIYEQPGEGPRPLEIGVPHAWTVTKEPPAAHRKLVAPSALTPYEEEGVAPPPEETKEAVPGTSAPAGAKVEFVAAPTSFEVGLDGGWRLFVTQEMPPETFWSRLLARLRDGWERLRGRSREFPPTLVLALAPEDAQKVHHRFREGAALLLVGDCGEAAGMNR